MAHQDRRTVLGVEDEPYRGGVAFEGDGRVLDDADVVAGDIVKTRGRLTFREGGRGALRVTSDVTYVYPVVRAESGSNEVVRTVVRREVVVDWDDPARTTTESGTFSVVRTSLETTNAGCDTYTGFFRPDLDAALQGDGPAVDPYDRGTAIRGGDGQECGTATRS
ncbi:hypothetical protein [Streptomyces sp. NPDC050264]|uniref:hypothetical protein n=1 Tax=Streptomyces sp. NPDC050264 TaxID=3155038 RepID=UPI00343411A9